MCGHWSYVFVKEEKSSYNQMQRKKFCIIKPLSTTLEAVMTTRHTCAVEFNRLRPLAGKFRGEFSHKLAKKAEDADDKKKITEIRAIIKREQVKNKWRQINRARQKRFGKSIDTVIVEIDGETITLDAQTPLEDAIMSNNSKSFTLSYGSLLLDRSQLHNDLGCLADTDVVKQILLGTYK